MNNSVFKEKFSTEEAILLAGMIHQAYQLFETGTLSLPRGFRLRHIIRALAGVEEPEEEVFGFIAESAEDIVVTFRGTRTFKDNESDQDLYQVPYPYVRDAGFTHRGFTCIYSSTRNELIRELNRLSTGKRVLIAGHSLGGSLAVLAALDIEVNTRFKDPIIYTYGSPRTGDPLFASFFSQTVQNSIRIVNIHDIIPTLPARVYPPPFTKDGLYYRHVNRKYPVSFQLNSLPVRNHEIVCYFHNLSMQNPYYTRTLCAGSQGFCPDTVMCVPFIGGCSGEIP
ncbi:lipase family protein [Cytobacillus firmus]|uniref:lipase family protein n=1 Tax=Cytobacillus firmus TaxID=1399 RepID=UPI00202E93A9|nr:lipase family protein [Cytobacillus firmus]URT69064.1 lipase family protein [Cytobacillus firmus]